MSLVGPRPLLMEYLDLYSPRQARRHEVRPGLTGLAQVKAATSSRWDERLELDVRYVETRTFALDLRIIVPHDRRSSCGAKGSAVRARRPWRPSSGSGS